MRQEVEAYGVFVDGEIARLGRFHPLVRTQYFCKEIDAAGGMFPPVRTALMQGSHPPQDSPSPFQGEGRGEGGPYVFLLDIAGADESPSTIFQDEVLKNSERDSTALTIVRLDFSGPQEVFPTGPRFLIVHRRLWTGERHASLYAQLKALIELWQPGRVVIDATGIGAGLAGFLSATFGKLVQPFIFSSKSKSELGWNFLAIVETGRFKDHAPSPKDPFQAKFQRQLEFCQMEILPGPGKLMRWGVPDGRRDPQTGETLHDDLVISAALCATLEGERWGTGKSEILPPDDPLDGMGVIY